MKRKIYPITYCHCCRKCKYRDKTKSLFDTSIVADCVNINDIGAIEPIPKLFYVINWCKSQETNKRKK